MTGKDPVLGIVAALPAEARAAGALQTPLGEAVSVADRVLLVRCGVGRVRAARAATAMLAAGAGSLLSWGTAAALDPGLAPGDLVLPGDVLAGDGIELHDLHLFVLHANFVLHLFGVSAL